MGNLLWRMLHGEVPKIHQPKLAVVMIGINDLYYASYCSGGDPHRISQVTEGVKDRWAPEINTGPPAKSVVHRRVASCISCELWLSGQVFKLHPSTCVCPCSSVHPGCRAVCQAKRLLLSHCRHELEVAQTYECNR